MAPLCPTPNFKLHLLFVSTSIDVDVELPPILPSHYIVYETLHHPICGDQWEDENVEMQKMHGH